MTNTETLNTEIKTLTAKLVGDFKNFKDMERLTFLTRVRDKPEYLKPGRYKVVEPVDNTIGDGRSNGAHWRSVLEKKVTIEPGFRFEVTDDGRIKDGRSDVCWFMYEDSDSDDKSMRRHNKRGRDFIEALMKASKSVEASLAEEFREHCGSYGGNGLRMLKAAINLGLDKDAMFAEYQRLIEETDED